MFGSKARDQKAARPMTADSHSSSYPGTRTTSHLIAPFVAVVGVEENVSEQSSAVSIADGQLTGTSSSSRAPSSHRIGCGCNVCVGTSLRTTREKHGLIYQL